MTRIAAFFFLLVLLTACDTTNSTPTSDADMKMAAINSNVQVHAWFTGKVQGVYFRKTTQNNAKKLGLVGWVKNLDDGRVEMVAEGPAAKIEELIGRLDKKFSVTDIKREDGTASEKFAGFEIRR